MTNKKVIETIKTAIADVEWNYPMDYAVAFEKAIEALEAQNKYRWHDLRKDPNDLPSVGKYLVKIRCELGEWYELNDFTENKNWIYIDFYHQEDATDFVVAWREIEPFEEV